MKAIKFYIKGICMVLTGLAALTVIIRAADPITREKYGTYTAAHYTIAGSSNTAPEVNMIGSTMTVDGQLLGWVAHAQGTTFAFQIKTSSGTGFYTNVSSPITVLDGNIFSDNVRGIVRNPLFVISTATIKTNATFHFTITYLKNE